MQISFDGQILAADTETRTIKGLVVPFPKVGNTSAGPVRFEFGAFGEIDPSQIVLNMEHDRTRPLGRGIGDSLEVSPAGISMAFKIAPTGAGNQPPGKTALICSSMLESEANNRSRAPLLQEIAVRGCCCNFCQANSCSCGAWACSWGQKRSC